MDITTSKSCSLPATAIFQAITKSLLDDYTQNTKEELREEELSISMVMFTSVPLVLWLLYLPLPLVITSL